MPGQEEDILVDIPDEDLPKLAEMYEKHKDWAPHAYSVITNGIEWRKKSEERYMIFMSPNNCWKEDGTFFVLIQYYSYDIFIFSLDDTGKNVYDAFMKTKRFDTDFSDRPKLLYSIHNNIYSTVVKAIKDRNWKLEGEIPCNMYSISRHEALKFEIECPSEVYIKKLEKTDAPTVSAIWPHRYKNSEKLISLLIEMGDCYGVFLKSSEELVSWVIISILGQLKALQTKEDYKNKGYGSLITKYVSKELAKKGHNAFGTVVVDNTTSERMFEKLGFKRLGKATYAFFR